MRHITVKPISLVMSMDVFVSKGHLNIWVLAKQLIHEASSLKC